MPSPYSGKVFSFDHNWTTPVVERLSWLTSVLRKRDGSEQRIRLRQRPRRTWEYTALLGGYDELDQRRRFDALLWSGQSDEIMVPFWPDAFTLSANLASGSTTLLTLPKLDGYDLDNSDSYLMFWQDHLTYEVLKISSTGISAEGPPGHVTFETATVNTWLKGTVVVPARRCLHDPTMSSNVFASDLQEPTCKFEVIIPTAAPTQGYRAITPSLDTYRDADVLLDPGMDGTNTRTLERIMSRIDFNVGQFKNDSIQAAPFGALDINVSLEGKAEIANFLGWLNMRWGRQKGFWLPTWEKDFDNLELTDTDVFTADSFGYTAAYDLAESRRDIAFINADGSMDFRRITASEDDDTTETFTVDSDLPDPLEPERASFLRYCRLDQDEIELSWITTEDVTTTLKARELIKTA